MEKFKKVLSILLRIVITLGLLFFLFRKVDIKDTLEYIKSADKWMLILSLVIYSGIYIFCFMRWHMLLKAIGIKLPMSRILSAYGGGIFFSLILPSTIGGDLVRSVDLATHTKRGKEVVATVLLDRLSGYVGLVLVAIAAVLLGSKYITHKSVFITVGIIVAVLVCILLVLFNSFIYKRINKFLDRPDAGKIRETIKDLHEEVHQFRDKKIVIVKNILLSLAVQLIAPISFYFTGLSLGVKINWIYYFIFMPIIGAVTLLPISIGGFGVRENITKTFFCMAGVPDHAAVAMSLINDVFILFYVLLGGVFYALELHNRRLQRHKAPAVSLHK